MQFDPREIGNCAIWLDASEYDTLTFSGSNITSWRNKGKAGNAVQATGSAQPTYNGTGLNSRPTVTFDADDILTIAYNSAIDFTTCSTFVVAQRDTDTGGNQPLAGKYSTSGSFRQWNLRIDTGDSHSALASSDGTGGTLVQATTGFGITVSTPYVFGGHFDGTNVIAEVNNFKRTKAALASMVQAAVGYDIGGGFGSFLNGRISEVIHFNTVLSTANQLLVTQALAAKWGIAIGA